MLEEVRAEKSTKNLPSNSGDNDKTCTLADLWDCHIFCDEKFLMNIFVYYFLFLLSLFFVSTNHNGDFS